MNPREFAGTLATLFSELVEEAPSSGAYMLNGGDPLRSLEKLSATAASSQTATGSSIAAHVDHIRYGLSLMNRWSEGQNPFETAEWSASWKKTTVSDDEWRKLRVDLRAEAAAQWLHVLRTPREVREVELNGIIGSIAHLGYHLGAIRQINSLLRGPIEGSA